MVRKTQAEGEGSRSSAQFAETVKASAQQIWLAGLGAFAKAQEEGGKVFEALVKEGATMQRKTQAAAEDRFGDTATRMASTASELSSKASGGLDKLEGLFEERVARALNRLGVPSARDVEELTGRVEELTRLIERMNAAAPRPPRRAAKAPPMRAALRRPPRRRAG